MVQEKKQGYKKISGEEYKSLIISAAYELEKSKEKINDLNVFPVPDGDTGSNMAGTVGNAAKELINKESGIVSQAADITAQAMLRGARGNSGVIVSLLFRGIAKGLENCFECDGVTFANALVLGVEEAYRAVERPAEGTILTVAKKSAQASSVAAEKKNDFEYVLDVAIKAAEKALEETVKENPVLERAGVVDAGGMGWLVVMRAMHQALIGKGDNPKQEYIFSTDTTKNADFSSFSGEDIAFAYCTELILKKKTESALDLKEYLSSIGDSLVFVDDGEIVKVHIHTNTPYEALGKAMEYGEIENVKIENMRSQHTNRMTDMPKTKNKEYGFVAVSSGDGMRELFSELGADIVVKGGQTMNPSCEELTQAINDVGAETVFVLPNNKNVIMASRQACEQSGKNAVVVPTCTVPQGISAMLAFDEQRDCEENLSKMEVALSQVSTFQITYAVRDSSLDGIEVKAGEYLALWENKLLSSGAEIEGVFAKICEKIKETGKETVSVYYGEDVKEGEALKSLEKITELLRGTGADINLYRGGQSIYYYIISAE